MADTYLSCRICGNAENNTVHRAREMMFGLRETFDYLECAACGTLQITEIPDLRRFYPPGYYSFEPLPEVHTKDFRHRLARIYFVYKRFIRNFAEPTILKKYLPDYVPLAHVPGLDFESKILDFGCGAGWLLRELREIGFRRLTGADAFIEDDIFYPDGVKIYKRGLDRFEPFFDLIMLHHSFEHLPDPLEILTEVHRLLAKGGVCLIRTPVVNFAWEVYGVNWVQLDAPRHLFLFTEEALRSLAEKSHLTVEKVIYDSDSFQFWGSEQYARDIPMTGERAFKGDLSESIFTKKQMRRWQRQAEKLNAQGKGDQACFYLRKI